ncbi:MAG: hypothetical protein QM664_09905 [Flavihumibacter sp.]
MSLFTQEDLLLYFYKETSAEQNAAIESAMMTDFSLREEYELLLDMMQPLNQPLEAPRTEVVINVLNYAREAAEAAHDH